MIQYSFYPANKGLKDYIFSYGTMELAEGVTTPLVSPPNGLTGFLIRVKSDEKALVHGRDFEGNPIACQPNYAIGQTTHPISGYATGQLTILVVFFQPLGMYQLFGYDMDALSNKSVDVTAVLGATTGNALIQQLKQADSIEKQVGILDDFLLQQTPIEKDCAMLKKAIDMIHSAEGNINILAIETALQINRRTLERHFKQKIGISPKAYAQVYRFKCAMNYLQANPSTTWASLTYNNGFYDQAHLIRYFQEYLKVSPNNLVKLDLDFINYLLRH